MIEADLALLDLVKRGEEEEVGWLLAAGADANCRDLIAGRPALWHAVQAGHAGVARLLMAHGAEANDPSLLDEARRLGHGELADLLRRFQARAGGSSTAEAAAPPAPGPLWARRLAWFYRHHGYVRRPVRRPPDEEDGNPDVWEVRFLFSSKRLLEALQRVLKEAGFRTADLVRKNRLYLQPLPGQEAVERVLALARSVAPEAPYAP